MKGAPINLEVHNFGSIDSVAAVIFCAGKKRYSVPHARFLIHGVAVTLSKDLPLEEKNLDERLKSLRIDAENIAGVIATNTGKSEKDITQAMHDRTTLNPEQALEFGLIHEIKEALFEKGVELISIQ